MKKILIITYYWPPSGGAGVQRWLKFTKYLPDSGIEPVVLTVDSAMASYAQYDETLEKDVSGKITVYRTRTREFYNLYKRLTGKKEIPYGGFANEGNISFVQWLARVIRGNFFLPDPRRGWNRYAFKKAAELIREHGIDSVITTSPPHSTQLIGLKLKKRMGVYWIADLRDPWTDIYYYRELHHSALARMIDRKLERKILANADQLITVSHDVRRIFEEKLKRGTDPRFLIIPNGYDKEDFGNIVVPAEKKFIITYTGTIAESYDTKGFLNALAGLDEKDKRRILLRFVGQVSTQLTDKIRIKIPEVELDITGYVDHSASVRYQLQSSLQLLVIPRVENNKGIVPAKFFEYMASARPVLSIGPKGGDLEEIIVKTGCGKLFGYDEDGAIMTFLKEMLAGRGIQPVPEKIKAFSRESLARKLAASLFNLGQGAVKKQILVSRPLSPAERYEVAQLASRGWSVHSASSTYFHGNCHLAEPPEVVKRRVNYKVMDELLALGDMKVGEGTFSGLFRIEQASVWHYNKLHIYLEVRNLMYEIDPFFHLLDDESQTIWYCSKEMENAVFLFPDVAFRINKQVKKRLNVVALAGYGFLLTFRVLLNWFSYRKHPKYLLYLTEEYSTVLDRKTFKPQKGYPALEYLIERMDNRFHLLTEMPRRKIRGSSEHSFSLKYLKLKWEGRRKHFVEPFMISAKFSSSLRKALAMAEQRLRAGYGTVISDELSLEQKLAFALFKSFHDRSRFFLFRYFAARRFFTKSNLKAVITSDENSPFSRSISDAARSCGIPIVDLQNGAVNDLHPAYRCTPFDRDNGLIPDLTLVWGKAWEQFLVNKGNYPATDGSVKVTGLPRTDIIRGLIERRPAIHESTRTVIFASQLQHDPHLRYQAAFDVFSAASHTEGCWLVVKLHPKEIGDASYYKKIASRAGCKNYSIDLKSDLYTLIASCDLLITCFSTAGAEAVFFEKPLVILDYLKQDIQGYVREGVAFQATGKEELQQLMAKVLDGSLRVDKERYRAFIQNYVGEIDGHASERVIAEITSRW